MAIITLNRASIYEYAGILLVAGDNEVTAEQMKVLMPNKGIGIRDDVEAGLLTVAKIKASKAVENDSD